MSTRSTLKSYWYATVLSLGAASIAFSGCAAKDSAKNSRVTGQTSTSSASTTGPDIPTPPGTVGINPGTVVDSSNEGGTDSVTAHQTASGALNISKVSVGGSYQRDLSVSTSFKVRGGIYVR